MKKNHYKNSLLLALAGLGLNFICKNLVLMLGLPIYLDSIGTVLVASLSGVLPGMVVGFITNIIVSVTDPISLYFAVISALIAVIAAWASRNRKYSSLKDVLIVWLLLVLVGGVGGSYLSWNLYGAAIGGNAAPIAKLLHAKGMAPMHAQLLGDLVIDMADKALTLLPVLLLLRFYPAKLKDCFTYSHLYDGSDIPDPKYSYRFNITNKINYIIIISSFVTGLCAALFGWSLINKGSYESPQLFLIKVLSIEMGAMLFITALATFSIEKNIISNIRKILKLTRDFEQSDKLSWLENDAWVNRDKVDSRDELHDVYEALCDVQENVVEAVKKDKQQEIMLEDAFNAAEKANAAKTDFLSAMSHDIRTPMNAISGMIDIALLNKDDPDKIYQTIEKIKISSTQMITLLNDILDISAIETGKLRLTPGQYNLNAAFDQYYSLFKTMMEQRSLDCTMEIHDIKSPWLEADELRLRQIFVNLISNAVKYTPEGGSIRIEVYQQESEGQLYTTAVVSDTGIGMSEEFMEIMWDSFSRATDTRINKIQGAGLGLNIVKKLVDMMEGTIDVKSRLNEGSEFKVMLPLKPVDHVVEEAQLSFEGDDSLDAKLLVAEDNDMNWEIACELLSMKGLCCTRAVNGQECLKLFEKSPAGSFDAILMDMQMPVMGGVEATEAIRRSGHPEAKTIPIIAMTANAFTEDIERCIKAGMNDHLSKPIDMKKVMETLRIYINKA